MAFKKYLANSWVANNPVLLGRVMRGFARAVVGKNTLKTIELFPTYACPLKCSMCSVEKYKRQKKVSLELSDYERLASQGASLGAVALTVLGGEPLSYNNLDELLSIFKKEKYYCFIVSGGTLVTRERLADLKSAGLDYMAFSLDSMNPARNDAIRGEGHFAKIMENVDLCLEMGIRTALSPVFFHGQMEDGIDVINFCREKGINATGGQVAAVGNAEKSALLTKEEHDQVRQLLKDYPLLTFDWGLSYRLRHQCPAGKEKIGITQFGDVVGCSVNPISFGNVQEEPLENIWRRMGKFSEFKRHSPVCLAAEDMNYINEYLGPVHQQEEYPLSYLHHPNITREKEPGVYD